MNQHRLSFLLVVIGLLIALAGCQPDDRPPAAATPDGGTALIVARDAVAITLADLAAAPEAVEGRTLRLTGRYQALPALICSGEAHPSPATWGLTGDGALAYAGGFTQLRRLVPEGLTMTVEGRWRVWRGPVGCGKQAVFTEVWYLDVTRIVAPGTIARVTLTPPVLSAELLAQLGTPTIVADAPPGTPTAPGEAPAPTSAPAASPAASPTASFDDEPEEEAAASQTPTSTPSATRNPDEEETAEAELTSSPTPGTGTPGTPGTPATPGTPGTPTATPAGGGGTPTPTGGAPGISTATPATSPTATTSPVPGTVTDMGDIDAMFLAVERLGGSEIHSWNLTVTAGNTITASVASPAADLVLTLLNSAGTVVLRQNGTSGSGVETLVQTVSTAGIYRLHVETTAGAPAEYALMIRYNESYAFILRGTMLYGDSKSVTLRAQQDHFWHFAGAAGDSVTITVVPDANSDPFMKLYDTEAEDVSGFIDDGFTGESEQYTYTLPVTGLYSIRVGEFDFEAMDYTIVVVKN